MSHLILSDSSQNFNKMSLPLTEEDFYKSLSNIYVVWFALRSLKRKVKHLLGFLLSTVFTNPFAKDNPNRPAKWNRQFQSRKTQTHRPTLSLLQFAWNQLPAVFGFTNPNVFLLSIFPTPWINFMPYKCPLMCDTSAAWSHRLMKRSPVILPGSSNIGLTTSIKRPEKCRRLHILYNKEWAGSVY